MADRAELRILHWNVHSWTDTAGRDNHDRVVDLIRATGADVVCLVEVDEPITGRRRIDAVAAAISCHTVFVPGFDYGDSAGCGQFGNAILSRYPVLDVRHHPLLWPPPVYDGAEPSEPRSLDLARIQAPNGPVWIGATHLPRADTDAREAAMRRLLAAVSDLPTPWLVAGDFNTPSTAWLMTAPRLRAFPFASPTHPVDDPVECIDYALAPYGLDVDAEVVATTGSDHYPILIRLR